MHRLLLMLLLAFAPIAAARAQPSFVDSLPTAGPVASASDDEEQEPEVQTYFELNTDSVAPGSELLLAVVIDHAEKWHTNLNEPVVPEAMSDYRPVATTLTLPEVEGIEFGPVVWPEPVSVPVDFLFTGTPVEFLVYEDDAVVFVPVRVTDAAAAGEVTFDVSIMYQACDDRICLQPQLDTHTVSFTVAPDAEAAAFSGIFADYDPGAASSSSSASSSGEDASIPGREFLGLFTLPALDSLAGVAVLALLAAVGGFVLNLTPCVLPVLPIKVMTITQHAGEKRGKALMLSLWMAAGVVAFWIGIGIPMAFVADSLDPSKIFGFWWLTAIIGLVILFMGIGIMGLFQIKLPQKVYMVNPKADSAWGSFVFGVMTAVLGLPCFGFVAGALLAGAATMPPMLVMTVFVFMGVGMALPYVALAVFPALLKSVPRTGPASELVKQIMGLLMLAAAAYFLGTSVISYGSGHGWNFVWWGKTVHWWAIGLVGAAAGLWLAIQTVRITKSLGRRLVFTLIGGFFAFSGTYVAYGQTVHQYHNFWQPYSPEFLQSSLENGQVVVLDFTAEWCLNCKALEAAVLAKDPVKPQLLSADVVPMVADLTSLSAPGWTLLNDELGQTGIPFLAIFAPGHEKPIWASNAYNASQVLDGIEKARSAR